MTAHLAAQPRIIYSNLQPLIVLRNGHDSTLRNPAQDKLLQSAVNLSCEMSMTAH